MSEVVEMVVALPTRGATRRLGRRLSAVLAPGDLVVLEGDLGAGKTFLVRSVARGLGVPPGVRVTSPTFELVHELPGRVPLLHVDLYRLSDEDSLLDLGILECIGGDAAVLVEWGDRFAQALGNQGLWLWLAVSDEHGRSCRLQGRGTRGEALLSRLREALDVAPIQW